MPIFPRQIFGKNSIYRSNPPSMSCYTFHPYADVFLALSILAAGGIENLKLVLLGESGPKNNDDLMRSDPTLLKTALITFELAVALYAKGFYEAHDELAKATLSAGEQQKQIFLCNAMTGCCCGSLCPQSNFLGLFGVLFPNSVDSCNDFFLAARSGRGGVGAGVAGTITACLARGALESVCNTWCWPFVCAMGTCQCSRSMQHRRMVQPVPASSSEGQGAPYTRTPHGSHDHHVGRSSCCCCAEHQSCGSFSTTFESVCCVCPTPDGTAGCCRYNETGCFPSDTPADCRVLQHISRLSQSCCIWCKPVAKRPSPLQCVRCLACEALRDEANSENVKCCCGCCTIYNCALCVDKNCWGEWPMVFSDTRQCCCFRSYGPLGLLGRKTGLDCCCPKKALRPELWSSGVLELQLGAVLPAVLGEVDRLRARRTGRLGAAAPEQQNMM